MSTTAAVILFVAITMYAVFGGADFGAGFWDLIAGRRQARRATARGHRPLDRARVGGEPRLADLRVRGALDLLPGGLCLDHADALRAADPGGLRHRPARSVLRVPQVGVPHPRPSQLRRGLRALVGAGALLPRDRGRRHRLRTRPVGGQGGRSLGQLGEPDVRPRWRARRHRGGLSGGVLPGQGRGPTVGRHDGGVLPPTGDRGRSWWPASCRWWGSSCCTQDADYVFDGLTSRALPLVILSGLSGIVALVLVARGRRGARRPPCWR